MNAATETEIILLPPQDTALQVYTTANGLDPFIAHIRAQIDEFNSNVPDLSTAKNRQLYASMAHKVAKAKNALDAVGKELSAEAKKKPKVIDAERKRCWDLLESWQAEVRKPLDDWQAAEDARIDQHQAGLDHLRNTNTEGASAAMIKALIQDLAEVTIGDDWQEFEADAHRAKAASLATLNEALAAQERREAEAAELEALRKQKAERDAQDERDRIAREAADAARQEAERTAQAQRDAAAQRERDLEQHAAQLQREAQEAQQRAEQAERNRIAAEQQAEQDRIAAEQRQVEAVERANQQERQRQADEKARAEAAAKAREADTAHKTAVLTAIKESFMLAGITEAQARAVINMIRREEVPRVSITY
ncbi:hypothetical protein SAMN05216206_2797 [Pseudomonas guineae]|uniref:Uncharacterized protein n=1 Tax=Pseudomonas guineae TaxID=425504 RepID=A0A1I3KF05_9PSED|nr:hypothetical protein [Pseudomonas guineae]SFI70795.1 hypothetical protein SAMN05216206_2797 [Pseudomonas guineae]